MKDCECIRNELTRLKFQKKSTNGNPTNGEDELKWYEVLVLSNDRYIIVEI
jgi:hypothetical protein